MNQKDVFIEYKEVHALIQESDYEWFIVSIHEDLEKAKEELQRCLKEYDQDYYIKSFRLE